MFDLVNGSANPQTASPSRPPPTPPVWLSPPPPPPSQPPSPPLPPPLQKPSQCFSRSFLTGDLAGMPGWTHGNKRKEGKSYWPRHFFSLMLSVSDNYLLEFDQANNCSCRWQQHHHHLHYHRQHQLQQLLHHRVHFRLHYRRWWYFNWPISDRWPGRDVIKNPLNKT